MKIALFFTYGYSLKTWSDSGTLQKELSYYVELNKELLINIRYRRKVSLSNSDWTQMPDSPLSDAKKQEWSTYRQALRDLPETYIGATSIDDIIWPTKPE